jgi:hypothetical protein
MPLWSSRPAAARFRNAPLLLNFCASSTFAAFLD